jgi:hypothetical protein
MAEHASLYGSILARFSPRVQQKLLALAETFHFKAGQDIIGHSSLWLYILIATRLQLVGVFSVG